jgi:hypothetical protein
MDSVSNSSTCGVGSSGQASRNEQDHDGRGMQGQGQDRGHGKTHWVNFHVGGCCESPSTMISACIGADADRCPGIGYVAGAGQVSLGIPGKIEGLLLAAV